MSQTCHHFVLDLWDMSLLGEKEHPRFVDSCGQKKLQKSESIKLTKFYYKLQACHGKWRESINQSINQSVPVSV